MYLGQSGLSKHTEQCGGDLEMLPSDCAQMGKAIAKEAEVFGIRKNG
jgi:hypothetical protein